MPASAKVKTNQSNATTNQPQPNQSNATTNQPQPNQLNSTTNQPQPNATTVQTNATTNQPQPNQSNTTMSQSMQSSQSMQQPQQPIRNTAIAYVDREKGYMMSIDEILINNIQLESDVYKYDANGNKESKPALENKKYFLTNDDFETVEELNEYLRLHGKIPEFLELRNTPDKGFGVFTTRDLPNGYFLGIYQGQYRPLDNPFTTNIKNSYVFSGLDFGKKLFAVIDAENITYANWTRFMNDGRDLNVEFAQMNYQVYAYTAKEIKAGTELLASYGEKYWEMRKDLITKKD